MRKSFTLIEVLISVLLFVLIAQTLLQITSQGTQSLFELKTSKDRLLSLLVLNNIKATTLGDVINIKDDEDIKDYEVSSEETELPQEDFSHEFGTISIKRFRQDIVLNDETKSFFRFK